ncbi:MAG: metallophosphoesterase [Nannocystaceae bacterium]
MTNTLAHLSDLHFGLCPRMEARVRALARTLATAEIGHVVVSGDLTHRGQQGELERFSLAVQPLRDTTAMSVVPGNHDRLGDDVAGSIMADHRVLASSYDELYMVRLDSTAPHNCRYPFEGHGMLTDQDLERLDDALGRAPRGVLTVVTMHHHPLPLPEEGILERLSSWIGLPYAAELATGPELLACLRGRCDLLLHGHRHVPSGWVLPGGHRPLSVFNAGSSPQLGRVRVFEHRDGRLLGPPRWLQLPPSSPHSLAAERRPPAGWPHVEPQGGTAALQ